jgi:hypothetical protein
MNDSLVDIPRNKSDWNIDVLDKLIKLRDIESDTFDFKSDYKKLSLHLCAFANNSFGQMVLGIEELKKGEVVYGFKKKGFLEDDLNSIQNEINNAMVNVDPAPTVTISVLNENQMVYPIIKIEGENSKKPYFQKGTGTCFVRIGSSSVPASRATILHLFSDIIRRIENVEKLKASAEFLKEMIMYTCEKLEVENYEDPVSRITPLDLSLFKNCTLDTQWFLIENNLYGGHIKDSSSKGGIHSFLYDLELFNIDINIYNTDLGTTRAKIKKRIDLLWKPRSQKYDESLRFLDGLLEKSRIFIDGKKQD